jgi:hypothetical protein
MAVTAFASGTQTANEAGTSTAMAATTLTDTGKTWTPDVYIGQTVEVVEDNVIHWALITDNDATSLTFAAWTPHIPTDTTQAYIIRIEHFLSSVNAAGTYTLHVDTVNMAAGDVLSLRIYQMVLTSGTARVAYVMRYYGAQATDDLIKISVPISNELTDAQALRFSLKQTKGAGRDFPYKVLKHA